MPRPGDFGLSPGGGLLMAAVRLGTFSRYGHACICSNTTTLGNIGGMVEIIEAYPGGCRKRRVSTDEFTWSNIELSDTQRNGVVDYAHDTLGLPYDWRAIAGFLARFWWAKATNGSGDHADDKLICSELVVWAYREGAKLDLAPGRAPGDVSPGDLADYLVRN